MKFWALTLIVSAVLAALALIEKSPPEKSTLPTADWVHHGDMQT